MSHAQPRLGRPALSLIPASLVLCALLFTLAVLPAAAGPEAVPYLCDYERLGFGVTGRIADYDLTPLNAGWYVNWGTAPQSAHPAGLDFAQISFIQNGAYSPTGPNLKSVIDRSPGSLWLIGNEPDSPYQSPTAPGDYAQLYYAAYHEIKRLDPAAQVGIGGMVQASPLRMQWLDATWNAYLARYGVPMPVDVWNVHGFVLREVRPGKGFFCAATAGFLDAEEWGADIPPGLTANCGMYVSTNDIDNLDVFKQQIVRFRTWMRDHGQQNKPLIVSEYGILFPTQLGYDFTRVRNYLYNTFDWMISMNDPALGYPADGNRLVQRWAWYSLDDIDFGGPGYNTVGALINPTTKQLTPMGNAFKDYATNAKNRCSAYVDLQAVRLRVVTPPTARYGESAAVRLEVDVSNSGPADSTPTQMRFWSGDPGAGGTLLGSASLGVVQRDHQALATAGLNLTMPLAGEAQFTVEVDVPGLIAESQEDNNRLAVGVSFGAYDVSAQASGWQLVAGPLRPSEPAQLSLLPATAGWTQTVPDSLDAVILPPAIRAVWYDGDPATGGVKLAEQIIEPDGVAPSAAISALAWNPVMVGARRAYFVVSLRSGLSDSNPANNQASLDVPASTDLSIAEIAYPNGIPLTAPAGSGTASIRFRLANLGTFMPAGQLVVGVQRQDTTPVGQVALLPTGAWTADLAWGGLAAGIYSFVATVDPANVFPETNEDNNLSAGSIMMAQARRYLPVGLRLGAAR